MVSIARLHSLSTPQLKLIFFDWDRASHTVNWITSAAILTFCVRIVYKISAHTTEVFLFLCELIPCGTIIIDQRYIAALASHGLFLLLFRVISYNLL
ncbi:hypothetical protein QGX23_gp052 [Pseudomonas phage PN09]|uniref:Uncharacterized protein n=1 Tax=Pseudomonas phage PN09 TaxID=2782564 RepID=A0A7S7YBZ8_9CAUD|nr:hypothetical protein QGX23_gp052 [Pseudomonas phage PN09]QPB10473.1 hypothetical protein PN09_052 [Pseudomonas phage PN09]